MYLSLESNQAVTVRLEPAEIEALESGWRDEETGNTMIDRVRFAAERFARSEDPEEGRLYHSVTLCAPSGQRIRTISLTTPKEVR